MRLGVYLFDRNITNISDISESASVFLQEHAFSDSSSYYDCVSTIIHGYFATFSKEPTNIYIFSEKIDDSSRMLNIISFIRYTDHVQKCYPVQIHDLDQLPNLENEYDSSEDDWYDDIDAHSSLSKSGISSKDVGIRPISWLHSLIEKVISTTEL